MKAIATFLIAALAGAPVLGAGPKIANQPQAEALFAQYQARERAFDPAAADLYCDTALIRNVRSYPDGQQRTLELPAPKYKALIRAAMPMAQAKGDYSTYSEVSYRPEGDGVRVSATRTSVLKQYASPISLLVGRCAEGADWGILEELSQSQP